MVLWFDYGPWPFQRPLPLGLGPWALVFGFWAMSRKPWPFKGLGFWDWLLGLLLEGLGI